MAFSSSISMINPSIFSPNVSSDTSTLSFVGALRCSQLRGSTANCKGLIKLPHRTRAVPKISAKNQTFSSFHELLEKAEKPVLVDFYATWCGPCQMMVPVLEEVSSRLNDVIQVVKIDTEKYPNIASKYNVEALPTFIIFKDGKPYNRFEGALPADKLIQHIENVLNISKREA